MPSPGTAMPSAAPSKPSGSVLMETTGSAWRVKRKVRMAYGPRPSAARTTWAAGSPARGCRHWIAVGVASARATARASARAVSAELLPCLVAWLIRLSVAIHSASPSCAEMRTASPSCK